MSQSSYSVNPNYGERIASLEAMYSSLAKEADIERLNGKIDTSISEIKRFVVIWALIVAGIGMGIDIGSPLVKALVAFLGGLK